MHVIKVGATQNAEQNTGLEYIGPFYATEAIAAGDVVAIDPTVSAVTGKEMTGIGCFVKKADSVGTALAVGIADQAWVAGDLIRVVKRGIVRNANMTTGITAGTNLAASNTDGRLIIAGTAGYKIVAVALEAEANNAGDVYVTL